MTSSHRNNGSKQRAVRIIQQAMEIINLLTGLEPVQVLVTAIQAGGARRQGVDVSPLRRVNQAIYLICKGSRESAFRNVKSIAECLADEIINAAKGTGSNSAAARKKDEIERVAKGNR